MANGGERFGTESLIGSLPGEKTQELARILTHGTWTHDFPSPERARELGLSVRDDMPENALSLLQLYPQPIRRQPAVEYLPVPY